LPRLSQEGSDADIGDGALSRRSWVLRMVGVTWSVCCVQRAMADSSKGLAVIALW
jgi:hypothetical protein